MMPGADVTRLVEVLRFYALPENWEGTDVGAPMDGGARARAALGTVDDGVGGLLAIPATWSRLLVLSPAGDLREAVAELAEFRRYDVVLKGAVAPEGFGHMLHLAEGGCSIVAALHASGLEEAWARMAEATGRTREGCSRMFPHAIYRDGLGSPWKRLERLAGRPGMEVGA